MFHHWSTTWLLCVLALIFAHPPHFLVQTRLEKVLLFSGHDTSFDNKRRNSPWWIFRSSITWNKKESLDSFQVSKHSTELGSWRFLSGNPSRKLCCIWSSEPTSTLEKFTITGYRKWKSRKLLKKGITFRFKKEESGLAPWAGLNSLFIRESIRLKKARLVSFLFPQLPGMSIQKSYGTSIFHTPV